MTRSVLSAALVGDVLASVASGQSASPRPPVIDMHVHSNSMSPKEAIERMKTLNIRYLFVSSVVADLPGWAAAL